MSWTESALMLSVERKTPTQLKLNLLTKNHGVRPCSMTLDPKNTPMLLPGCELEISGQLSGTSGLVDVHILDVSHGINANGEDDPAIQILSNVSETINILVPESEPVQDLYEHSIALIRALEENDKRWPIHYIRWEVTVLDVLGLMSRFKRCRTDYLHGESIYMSPRTGKVVTRVEAGAFLDRLKPVPKLIMGARDGSVVDVRQSFELVTTMFKEFVFPTLSSNEPIKTRDRIAPLLDAIDTIPPLKKAPQQKVVAEDERAKRLAALQPITVSNRISSSS